ncbi:hypothetical protein K2173_020484 [Erythroxylum novogranatense]|uniref:SET domain-containing protein n=1 Tax=Erythroxylum novogranatense TaxID=1862640 RepID=A0AAV8TIB8_9ROSI|nr:hypothetical protein K2173_020484 [Erythroxylum novogranatense]
MFLSSSSLTKHCWCLRHFSANIKFSSSSSKPRLLNHQDKDCEDFLPWLERKAGVQVSSKVYIGKSAHGRSLFAAEDIRAGECILQVPYNVQVSPDCLLPKVRTLLENEVGNVAKLAVVLLVEQNIGLESEWAPYTSRLPQPGDIHSTIFWSERELEMIRQSSLYQETMKQNAQIERDFSTIKLVLDRFYGIFEGVTLRDFKHAHALVGSRAWGSSKGASLIPLADFLNHQADSEAFVLNDEDMQVSEVIADHDYAAHEEVFISYGKFSNSTLLLEYGFALPYNKHEEVQISIPHHDLLPKMKFEILQGHLFPVTNDANVFKTSGNSFTIKEVKSVEGKGKGLPQSLRAFARVLSCTSHQELEDLTKEAAETDGRLARRPLKDISREIQAHEILLSRFSQLIGEYNASIESLEKICSVPTCENFATRRKMALNLLNGELRVLESASAWLKNYCATLH